MYGFSHISSFFYVDLTLLWDKRQRNLQKRRAFIMNIKKEGNVLLTAYSGMIVMLFLVSKVGANPNKRFKLPLV